MTTELFHYTTEAGGEITLPRFRNVPAGVVRKLRGSSEVDFIFGMFEAVADEATLAAIDAVGMVELRTITTAWQQDSDVTVGESGASSSS